MAHFEDDTTSLKISSVVPDVAGEDAYGKFNYWCWKVEHLLVRYVLLNFGNDAAKKLLGHNQTTLSAPAEVSVWTKFCEIDLPQATSRLLSDLVEAKKEISAAAVTSSEIESSRDNILLKSQIIQLPEELAKYEAHLRQPIRMHNIRKRMQAENFTSSVDGGDPIIEFARWVVSNSRSSHLVPRFFPSPPLITLFLLKSTHTNASTTVREILHHDNSFLDWPLS